MDSTTIATLLQQAVPEAQIETVPSLDLQATIDVSPAHAVEVMRALRDRPELHFAVLLEITAVDFWPREPRFELIYMLMSIERHLRLRVKVRLHGADARVPTMSALWPAANWLEREVWDLFGIAFDGHPDPRRLLMPEDWEGYPLRKDYPVQIRKKPETTEPMQVTAEQFRERVEKDRLARR